MNGCGIPVRPLTPQLVEQARGDKQTIVLLRLAVEADGKPINTLSPWRSAETGGSSLEVTALDATPSPQRVEPAGAPSAEAWREGWVYFILGPGTYHLQFVPPHRPAVATRIPDTGTWRRGWTPTGWFSDPTFWFHVSGDDRALYIGSLQVSCITLHGLLAGGSIDECSEIRLVDETEVAGAVGGFGPMPTALMQEYGAALADQRIDQLVPLRLVATGAEALRSPGLITRNMARAVAPGGIFFRLLGHEPFGMSLATMLFGAYAALALPAGAISGSWAASRLQPCMDSLAEEVREFDWATRWQASIGRPTAPIPGLDQRDASGARGVLQLDTLDAELRECAEPWTFCVRVVVRARLWEAATHALLLDELLRCTTAASPAEGWEQAPYYLALPVPETPCRHIDAYCSPDGRQLFEDDLSNAVQHLAERVRHDLGLEGGEPAP